jgi:hypothetical protein
VPEQSLRSMHSSNHATSHGASHATLGQSAHLLLKAWPRTLPSLQEIRMVTPEPAAAQSLQGQGGRGHMLSGRHALR